MKLCNIDGCERKFLAKDLCRYHYMKKFYPKKPKLVGDAKRKKNGGKCIVYGCESKSICKEMCIKHYARFKRHGDPEINYMRKYPGKLIRPTGYVDLVFDHD